MSIDRVVLIYNKALRAHGTVGSGYLLRRDRILTARHNIFSDKEPDDPSRIVEVMTRAGLQAPAAEWAQATPAWTDPVTDLALLAVRDPGKLGRVPLGFAPFRSLPRDRRVEVRAIGFPRFRRDGFPDRVTGQSRWNVLDASGYTTDYRQAGDRRFSFEVSSFGPDDAIRDAALKEGVSWWAGMSGASLLLHEHVTGVVVVDESEGLDRAVLQVVPLRLALAAPEFRKCLRLGDPVERRTRARSMLARRLRSKSWLIEMLGKLEVIQDQGNLVGNDQADALAGGLLSAPLLALLGDLRVAVENLSDTHSDASSGRRDIRELAETVASIRHLDEVGDRLNAERLALGAPLVSIPCFKTMVAEIVMAGADGRKPEFVPRTSDIDYPDGRQLLTSPPESGFGWAKAEEKARAIRDCLIATFGVGTGTKLRTDIEDFMYHRFVQDASSRNRPIEARTPLAARQLKTLSKSRTFYMVLNVPNESEAREELEENLSKIKSVFEDLMFLGLTDDWHVEQEEMEMFGDLQTMLPMKE